MARYRVTPRAPGTSARQQAEWRARYAHPPDLAAHAGTLLAYVEAIRTVPGFSAEVYNRLVRELARAGHPILPKAQVRRGYLALIEAGLAERDERVLRRLRLKPTRTLSGVAPVTVLTKPYPCPGQCIFCPDDVRMPKSYLSNEPGAMRALMLDFDPYTQTRERVEAMRRTGHAVDKVELLILGGTWSAYPRGYQVWFVRRCLDALNGTRDAPAGAGSVGEEMARLVAAQRLNETAPHRNVGLVVETRPDRITLDEVCHLRRLGVTRVQLGVQSLDDHILALNKRGHTVEDVRRAFRLLRGAGFKLAAHIMPNLLGATPESDRADFRRLWDDPPLRPDELKIYPTGLLRGTELFEHYLAGTYRPYSEAELTDLLMACKRTVPAYCRINRVMRDIPAPDIATGVTTSNLRQIVQQRLEEAGTPCRCIRCREVRHEPVDVGKLHLEVLGYDTDHSREVFIAANTPQGRLAGFVRLSLPTAPAPIEEIEGQAIIRQVQVYGPVAALDERPDGKAQHRGIGRWLVEEAQEHARQAGFGRLAVIAAVGTREYYRKLGFELGDLYMSMGL